MKKEQKKAFNEAVSEKMHKMKDEDRPQAQKIAIAISEAKKHFNIPEKVKTKLRKKPKE